MKTRILILMFCIATAAHVAIAQEAFPAVIPLELVDCVQEAEV